MKKILAVLLFVSIGAHAQDLSLTCEQGYSATITNSTNMNPRSGKITVMKGDEVVMSGNGERDETNGVDVDLTRNWTIFTNDNSQWYTLVQEINFGSEKVSVKYQMIRGYDNPSIQIKHGATLSCQGK